MHTLFNLFRIQVLLSLYYIIISINVYFAPGGEVTSMDFSLILSYWRQLSNFPPYPVCLSQTVFPFISRCLKQVLEMICRDGILQRSGAKDE